MFYLMISALVYGGIGMAYAIAAVRSREDHHDRSTLNHRRFYVVVSCMYFCLCAIHFAECYQETLKSQETVTAAIADIACCSDKHKWAAFPPAA